MAAHLVKNMSLEGLREADHSHRDSALISLAMYGRQTNPRFAAIWIDPDVLAGDSAPVRERKFEPNWDQEIINEYREDAWYPTLAGIAAWEFEAPSSLLVFEKFSSKRAAPTVVLTNDIAGVQAADPNGVVTGLDMSVHRTVSGDFPAQKFGTRSTFLAVIHPVKHTQTKSSTGSPEVIIASRTAYNLQPLSSFKDKRDGLWSSADHETMLAGWSRGHHAIPYPKNVSGGRRQAVVHYVDDTFANWPDNMLERFDCGTPIEGPIKSGQLYAVRDEGIGKGYWPIRIGANGWAEHARFCITWAKQGRLKPRKRYQVVVSGVDPTPRRVLQAGVSVSGASSTAFSAPVSFMGSGSGSAGQAASTPSANPVITPGLAPYLDKIDKIVFDKMRSIGAHAAQIAVAKNSMLKLARSYTWAERNYPATNAHHMFRWASVIKMLLGMFACTHTDEELFVSKIHHLLPEVPDLPTIDPTARSRFRQLTLSDLLWHQSGFQSDREKGSKYDYVDAAYKYGRKLLPLKPGDFGAMLVKSKLGFIERPRREEESYNNFNYTAAAEVLSRMHRPDGKQFMETIQAFWAQGGPSVATRARAVPESQAKCLDAGEVPARLPPKLSRATLTGQDYETETGGPAPWVPRGYNVGGDAEFAAGFGYTIMSASMLVRILQGLYPGPIPPVQRLLHPDDIARFLTTNPGATNSEGNPASRGLGAGFSTTNYGGHPNALRIAHGGNSNHQITSEAAHYIWEDQGAESHLSFGCVINGSSNPADKVAAQVEAIEAAGLWDNDINLFPQFFQ